mmetsp:Transcript_40587/g.128956  ORF Transcript_40587/g.128956 Transcript_40587/m.128956 type:complete len:222 (-) Transcript_40587:6-671(-)
MVDGALQPAGGSPLAIGDVHGVPHAERLGVGLAALPVHRHTAAPRLRGPPVPAPPAAKRAPQRAAEGHAHDDEDDAQEILLLGRHAEAERAVRELQGREVRVEARSHLQDDVVKVDGPARPLLVLLLPPSVDVQAPVHGHQPLAACKVAAVGSVAPLRSGCELPGALVGALDLHAQAREPREGPASATYGHAPPLAAVIVQPSRLGVRLRAHQRQSLGREQ